jgi:hypothetical protein
VLHLFDYTICPILLYGCENWGTLSAYKINNNNLSLFETFKDWDFEKLRERPFNLKGGVCFFSKKNILIPNVPENNILILVEEK